MRVVIPPASRRLLTRATTIASLVFLMLGLASLAWPAFTLLESSWVQRQGGETVVPEQSRPKTKTNRPATGTRLAQFTVPRLRMNWVLLEGTDNRTLDKSVGHVEDTEMPGGTGNIGIAGHRNTHFRKLEWIRRGDDVVLTTSKGAYTYKVEWIRLFTPRDLYVLDPSHGPAITLITCFPFEYVGSAPIRFVVRALPDDSTKSKLHATD